MYCRLVNGKRYYVILLFLGVVLAAFGILNQAVLSQSAHISSRLMGMFTGMGFAFIGAGTIRLIHLKFSSPEKLKQEQIDQKDERNVQVLRVSYTITSISSSIMFAGLVFIFTFMGSITESYICLAALQLQVVIFIVVHRYFSKTM
jgi:hypothetical protein